MVYNAPDRVGGALVLDFVNTREAWLRDGPHHEFLGGYAELWAWAGEAAPRVDPAVAAAVHARALALRAALFGVFGALATGGRPGRPDLDAVNAAWRELATRPQIDPAGLGTTWTEAPDRPLGPVLASAAALLRDGPLERLRQCPGPDGWCGWLFLDRSRNGSRRWCSMALCGNPAKMRARAARRRAADR